jgi:PAS domain S-box-containing protein
MINRDKIIQIFKASPTPTSIIKADPPSFTFVQVNDAYTEMTQRDPEELLGNPLFEAFPENPNEAKPTGVEKLRNSFNKVISTKTVDEMDNIRYDIILDEGEFKEVFWKVINTPVFDKEGQVEFIINSATNITEQVLSERENNLMLNNTEDSFIRIDRDLIIQNFNDLFAQNYLQIFGISTKIGDSILEYAQPERREIVKDIYNRVFKGETIEKNFPVESAEGDTRYFNIKYKPARDENDEIIGSFISLIEKTEEHAAKLDLETNEARFRALVENGGDVVFILTPEGDPTYISPSIENVLGYSQEEAYEINMIDVMHTDDLSIVHEDLEACLEKPGETLKVTPARIRHKNGDYRWMEGTITNMLHDPVINGIVDNFRDVTDRVKAEQKIQEAKDKYQSLIQTINGVVWEAEPDTLHVTYMSPQALPILGHDPEVWRSTIGFWKEHIHPEDREHTYARFKELTHAGKNHELEYRYKKGNGEYTWVRDVITVLQKKGHPTVVRGMIIDINEIIEAQKQLIKTEKKYRNVVEHSTNMFYQHDTEGILNYVSPQSMKFLGYPPEEAMRNWTEYITDNPINLEGEKHTIKALETGETQPPYELELRTAYDKIIWVEVHEAPFIEDGEVTGIVGSLTDITERKKYEEQLSKSLERYDYASKATRDAIYDWDIVNDDLHWGEGFRKLFGHKPGEGTYPIKKYNESVHPTDRDEAFDDLQYTLKDASMDKWSYEYRFQRSDGSYAHVIENGYIIRNEDGEAIRMIGALRDITEKKNDKIKLEEAYKEKEAILESIDDGFFTVNKSWTVTYWNVQAERLMHTPKRKIIDQNLWDVFDDAIDNASYTNYHRAMHQNVTVTFEDYYEPIDKWFDISAYPSPEGISVFFKDITERKKSQQELERLNTELESRALELAASNEELEQFAYVASHDLQEPLRMVTSFLTQLEKKYSDELDEKANQYIHFAVDGAKRMRQIILDLLNYSRLNQDKSKREEVDLNSILEDVKALERSHIEEANAQIIANTLPTIYANPGPIKQVFQNLINNSIKYHKPDSNPIIELTYSETDTHWKFELKDNGIGIDEDFQDNIFQIFQRLHTRDQYSGTGIGLAITRKIIERHGGEIWVESKIDEGSTFYFTLKR